MKMKKIAAASLAVCVCALSGMSALAADVATTTSYDWNKRTDTNAPVTVTSVVKDVPVDTQVTYLVWGGTENTIKYIDQKAATATGATFEFTGKQSDIYSGSVVAMFGSNGTETLPKNFAFNEGVNVLKNGNPTCTGITGAWNIDAVGGNAFCGTVSGNVKEYGVKIGDTKYPAAGSTDDGKFCVIIKGLTADEASSAVAYAE